jgi:hypothetical protein
MPIVINGSGTVTGLSVGGLPDGIVDTDMLAAAAVTASKRGAGAILQVIHGSTTTYFQTSSDTMADIGLSASITPSSSSNKVLVFGNIGGIETSADDGYGGGRLLRDSTSIIADIDRGIGYTADSTRQGTNAQFFILDTPSSTSSITYKVQFRRQGSGTITTQTNSSRSAITLMEVAA